MSLIPTATIPAKAPGSSCRVLSIGREGSASAWHIGVFHGNLDHMQQACWMPTQIQYPMLSSDPQWDV